MSAFLSRFKTCFSFSGFLRFNVFFKFPPNAFYRATRMHSADNAVARCLSVRLSHAGILSKRINISSKFFHHRVARPFWFFGIKRDSNLHSGTPPQTGASNAKGKGI